MKSFLITIDTEGDNLWNWHEGDIINTNNTYYLQRFQDLCNKYKFKPIWLTNYEMISNDDYVSFVKKVVETNTGEIGIHLHAWNNPPLYSLERSNDAAPYLIEFPQNIMSKKIEALIQLIYAKTGVYPVTHRSGRWATNNIYFDLLEKNNILFDCSFTPYINWKKSVGQSFGSKGSNYTKIRNKIYCFKNKKIKEIPTTIIKRHLNPIDSFSVKSILKFFYYLLFGKKIWLRPNGNNLDDMLYLVNKMEKKSKYIMFMIHSSELMPGGSPTFKTKDDIEKLYKDLDVLFENISKKYVGKTMIEFADDNFTCDKLEA